MAEKNPKQSTDEQKDKPLGRWENEGGAKVKPTVQRAEPSGGGYWSQLRIAVTILVIVVAVVVAWRIGFG